MNESIIKHLKMINGEEVVCEIVDDGIEDDDSIIIRNAYSLSSEVDHERSVRYYTFRPYMMYQEGDDYFIVLNSSGILAFSIPTQLIKDQYISYVNTRHQELASEKGRITQEDIDRLHEMVRNDSDSFESTNVISFKDKLH